MDSGEPGGVVFLLILVLCIASWWGVWRRTSTIAQQRRAGLWTRRAICVAAACLATFGMFCVSGGLLVPGTNNSGYMVAILGGLVLAPLAFALRRVSPRASQPLVMQAEDTPDRASIPEPVLEAPGALSLPREFLFVYINHQGQSSRRKVRVMGIASNDGRQYLDGYCLERNALRTFRVDRIQGDLTDSETGELVNVYRLLAVTGKRREMDYKPTKSNFSWSEEGEEFDDQESITTVLFTGFAKARREELEALAEAARWEVRFTVSKSLDYLVCGPKAGPTKTNRAEELGISVISEKDFINISIDNEFFIITN